MTDQMNALNPAEPRYVPRGREPAHAGIRLRLDQVSLQAPGGTDVIGDVSLSIEPQQIVAIIGASGAGKSTLLDLLAGNVAPSSGRVHVNGVDSHVLDHTTRRRIGFVPQSGGADALPLEVSLGYAARLRLPAGTSAEDARTAARSAMARLHLNESGQVPIDRLSGGQRQRASIAVELVTDPDALLLDEPTSGLDPTTAASLMSELRALADTGRTIVVTTHHPEDLVLADRVVALSPDGRLSFDGTMEEAALAAGSHDPHAIHRRLTAATTILTPVHAGERSAPPDMAVPATTATPGLDQREPSTRAAPRRSVQWWTLTRRTLAGIRHNRLTTGIMLGAPAAIIAMFAVLFRPDSFGPGATSATPAIMIAFWVAFAGFFFGLTYGLLQVCPEVEAMRRERRAGVPAGLQILAKLTALGPILLAINTAMLVALRWLDRLPSLDTAEMLDLSTTLALDALSALALGLLVSALVRTPVQTSLALPMLCFPAVLFSGAMVPIAAMTAAGRAISAAIPVRWAFDSIGGVLGLNDLVEMWANGSEPAAAWGSSTAKVWITLVAFTIGFAGTAIVALARRLRPSGERPQ